ncbi:hypothetical protein [Candidatus Pristimantibacillus sp. PTI5]|uniref:hypothetical protein n=1 Tax=Candidatus Pristimantibacillus sp. PTI5 TaxID=3400422 RepID=UPI003B01F842
MKTIFFFFWNLIMGIKRAVSQRFDKDTTFDLPYSFLTPMLGKQLAASDLPDGQKLPSNKLQPSVFFQKDQQNHPRAKWQISCDNSRILFQSSA